MFKLWTCIFFAFSQGQGQAPYKLAPRSASPACKNDSAACKSGLQYDAQRLEISTDLNMPQFEKKNNKLQTSLDNVMDFAVEGVKDSALCDGIDFNVDDFSVNEIMTTENKNVVNETETETFQEDHTDRKHQGFIY